MFNSYHNFIMVMSRNSILRFNSNSLYICDFYCSVIGTANTAGICTVHSQSKGMQVEVSEEKLSCSPNQVQRTLVKNQFTDENKKKKTV